MAQVAVCDQCGKTEKDPRRWWEIDSFGQEIFIFGDQLPPFQFCSWECVIAYATWRASGEHDRAARTRRAQ